MADSSADQTSVYKVIPDELRKPLVHRDPPKLSSRPLPSRIRPDLKPAQQDHRMVSNRSISPSQRGVGRNDETPQQRSGTNTRPEAPSAKDLMDQIKEEEKNRLNRMDGYFKTPPRPRDGYGLQLRSQHDDINEYITGPKWLDRYVESAESQARPPLEPQIEPDKPLHREIRAKMEASTRTLKQQEAPRSKQTKTPPARTPKQQEAPLPKQTKTLPDHKPEKFERIFKAKKIRFKKMSYWDVWFGAKAEFADNSSSEEIDEVADYLRENPAITVRVRASVGMTVRVLSGEDFIKAVMVARSKAVIDKLKDKGIDPSRMRPEFGTVGMGPEDRIVEFKFELP